MVMQQRLIFCLVVVFGIFGLVSALCVCPETSQKAVFESSDLVAKIRFNAVSTSNATWIVYNATVLEVFKPKNTTSIQGMIITNTTLTNCNPTLFLMLGEDYLIAAKNNGQDYEIVECNGFPQHQSGRPMFAVPWDIVTNKTLKSLHTGKF